MLRRNFISGMLTSSLFLLFGPKAQANLIPNEHIYKKIKWFLLGKEHGLNGELVIFGSIINESSHGKDMFTGWEFNKKYKTRLERQKAIIDIFIKKHGKSSIKDVLFVYHEDYDNVAIISQDIVNKRKFLSWNSNTKDWTI